MTASTATLTDTDLARAGKEQNMSAEQNIETARQMYQAFGRGDVQAILDRVTDDVDWSTDAAIAAAPRYGPQARHGRRLQLLRSHRPDRAGHRVHPAGLRQPR